MGPTTGVSNRSQNSSHRQQTFGIPLHTDSVQLLGRAPLSWKELAWLRDRHRHVWGPRGIGLLYAGGGTIR